MGLPGDFRHRKTAKLLFRFAVPNPDFTNPPQGHGALAQGSLKAGIQGVLGRFREQSGQQNLTASAKVGILFHSQESQFDGFQEGSSQSRRLTFIPLRRSQSFSFGSGLNRERERS